MLQLIVKAKKLNRRKSIPAFMPDPQSIVGFVKEGFIFLGDEVENVPNPDLGKWYKDRDNNFYWGGGLAIKDETIEDGLSSVAPISVDITLNVKRKIEQVINAFETGSQEGNYSSVTKLADFTDPVTQEKKVQVTYGRSQTTEFGNLKILIKDYINANGKYAEELKPYSDRIGKQPSLESDTEFCSLLKKAGKEDPVMKQCQDHFFDYVYYQPAFNWFQQNGFSLALSMLVIYDSFIHSGRIHPFLRKRFSAVTPANGGQEKEWIKGYVDARHEWLSNHSNATLRNTKYRTACLKQQIENDSWDLSKAINANGVVIS